LGFWEFGRGGQGEGWGKGGSVYKQPETEVDDSCHKLGGFQVSRKGTKGKKGDLARGD
jgi:hypothetical protein